jgi:hypothetical protein
MSNTNCLANMQCPECKSYGPFWIDGSATFLVSDSGTEDYREAEWSEENGCQCRACGHAEYVGDFYPDEAAA